MPRTFSFFSASFRSLICGLMLVALALPVGADEADLAFADSLPMRPDARIVNGTWSQGDPTTVALVGRGESEPFCTGTLVGCNTVVTAAHCVCNGDGRSCQNLGDGGVDIFLQHGGRHRVSRILVPNDYVFGERADLAVMRLAEPVTGIAPTPINDRRRLSNGTPGSIVGFGVTSGIRDDDGLKRRGAIRTAACASVPGNEHVCWRYDAPIGSPGSNSNTCYGDSGGPLFATVDGRTVLAGVTSGGDEENCGTGDTPFDADVFARHTWIRNQAGEALGGGVCGGLPAVGGQQVDVFSGSGSLNGGQREQRFDFQVPSGASRLRLTANGTRNGLEVFMRRGSQPTTNSFDCRASTFSDGCDIASPTSGRWHVLVRQNSGSGDFQATATVFRTGSGGGGGGGAGGGGGGGAGGGGGGGSSCSAADVLCVDRTPGDNRFRVRVAFRQGGGAAQ
ncbi:MAG: trypsin-like serine protease, partial [Acidobacteriota bacterium]